LTISKSPLGDLGVRQKRRLLRHPLYFLIFINVFKYVGITLSVNPALFYNGNWMQKYKHPNQRFVVQMKKLVFFLFLVENALATYSQVITGTVMDKETGDKISFAAVYFGGTSVGTYSDTNGKFELDVSKYISMPLSISAVSYNSVTLDNFSVSKPLAIFLTPKVINLNEVVINAKSLARKRRLYLGYFKEVFLGTTYNAQKCEIINENAITFNYGYDKDTLKAYAIKPLQIKNRALGYKITYFLDKFEYNKNNKIFFYRGNIFFEEDLSSEGSQKEFFQEERKNAFIGSRMHFFRELWADNLIASGFVVQNLSEKPLSSNEIVIEDNNHKKYLSYKGNLIVTFDSKNSRSYIIFTKDRAFFDGTGYFDASAIRWEGQMADQRIGDSLPFEYVLKNK
jgi:hypothetical protein